jgi:tetratricopeptide (TPR) repeat protein
VRYACLAGFLLLVLAARASGFAQTSESPSERFQEANSLYQNGEFAQAEARYRQLLEEGVEGGSLYFNLANACFKQKRLGEAIYYWEKALRFDPGDREARENLEFANLLVVDRIEVPPDPLPVRILYQAIHWLTLRQESYLLLVLFTLANLFAGICLIGRSRRLRATALYSGLAAALLLVVFGASFAWKIFESVNRRDGIVVEPKVDIRSGPGAQNVTVFTIHEGSKVRVRSEASGWYLVSLANGWTGWVETSSIRVLR